MRALSIAMPAERRLLRSDGLQRWFLLDPEGPGADKLLAKQLSSQVAADARALEQWFQAAERNADLRHDACTEVEHWGTHEGAPYIVSAYPEGRTLAELMPALRATGPRAAPELVAAIAVQILDALAYVQGEQPGLTHLDLDIDTIRVRPSGACLLPEFGLWSALSPAEVSRCRFDSGRVQFCSPELVESRPTDPRSDIFSLGVLMYQLLTGELPFTGATQLVIAMAIADGKRNALQKSAPAVPEPLREIIEVMLATSADDRFHTAMAARAALSSTLTAARPELQARLAALFTAPVVPSARAAGSHATQMMASPFANANAASKPTARASGLTQAFVAPRGVALPPSTAPASAPPSARVPNEPAVAPSEVEPAPPPLFMPAAQGNAVHTGRVAVVNTPPPAQPARSDHALLTRDVPMARVDAPRQSALATKDVPLAAARTSSDAPRHDALLTRDVPMATAPSARSSVLATKDVPLASGQPARASVLSTQDVPLAAPRSAPPSRPPSDPPAPAAGNGAALPARAAVVGHAMLATQDVPLAPGHVAAAPARELPAFPGAPAARPRPTSDAPAHELRANDGRTAHLRAAPSGLSQHDLAVQPPPMAPSGSPSFAPASTSANPPSNFPFHKAFDAPETAKSARGGQSPSAPPQGVIDSWRPPSKADGRGEGSGPPRAPAWSPSSSEREAARSDAPARSGRGNRWRDPSETVFQMKSVRPKGLAADGKKKTAVFSLLLISMILGFAAVVAVYFAYRLF